MLFLKHKLLNDCTKCTRDSSEAAVVSGHLERQWSEAWMSPGPGLGMLPWNPSALMEHKPIPQHFSPVVSLWSISLST